MAIAQILHDAERRLAAAGVEDARIEAEVLLMHALDLDRERLYARLTDAIDPTAAGAFSALLERRLAHEPAAYITGHCEFYGLDLRCTPDALIPRPETELLVELALERVGAAEALVVDVGTGNGGIAIAVAANAPRARVLAIDPSRAALRLARGNAVRHAVAGRIDFVQGSLLGALRARAGVILANLPYVPAAEYAAAPPELRREPRQALLAGERGTEVIEALLEQAPALLQRGGLLAAEHGWDQGEALRDHAQRSFPGARIETRQDLAGLDRALVVETT